MTVKPNDFRLMRAKKLTQFNSSLLLLDLAQRLQNLQPTHFDTRTFGKTSRFDYIFSNSQNITLQRNAIETLPLLFRHKWA